MYVCLCTGVTNHAVTEIVASGASTSKQIADACGAGADCGRCKHTLRSIIETYFADRVVEDVANAYPVTAVA